MPSYSLSASLSHFIDRIEKEAKSRGSLNGEYLVSLAPIPNFQEHEKWLFDELMSYIDQTRDQASADEYKLGKLGFHILSISKFQSDREYVAEAISFEAKFEGQAVEDFQRVIATILEKKALLLKCIEDPIFLLILDAFYYSHIVDWINVVLGMVIPPIFESLFRTHVEGLAQLLYVCSEWLKAIE